MQLPLDLCRRWGVQDHCNETEEDPGSPAPDGGRHPWGASPWVLFARESGAELPPPPPREHQATKPWQDGAPADPDVPVDRAGVAGLNSAGEGRAPRAGTVPPAQDIAHRGGIVSRWDPRGERHRARRGRARAVRGEQEARQRSRMRHAPELGQKALREGRQARAPQAAAASLSCGAKNKGA